MPPLKKPVTYFNEGGWGQLILKFALDKQNEQCPKIEMRTFCILNSVETLTICFDLKKQFYEAIENISMYLWILEFSLEILWTSNFDYPMCTLAWCGILMEAWTFSFHDIIYVKSNHRAWNICTKELRSRGKRILIGFPSSVLFVPMFFLTQ